MTIQPSEDEVVSYFDKLSNWGRWGSDDRRGALNLITDETRRAAARLIRDGQAVSLSRDMDPENPDPLGRGTVLHRYMEIDKGSQLLGRDDLRVEAVREYVGVVAHGSHTHLDGLAHFSWGGKNYNGFAASDTSSTRGARSLSMHHARAGVVTRGVLLDIAAVHGVPWLDPGHPITPAELVAAERRQAVTAGPGDALLIDNVALSELAAVCDSRQRWDFFFTMLPWRMVGVTSSIVNPVALF
jgi:hypothetical protein